MTDAILTVSELRKSFGGIKAVDGASFDIEAGTVTGLIGPNGAGKTTTFNLISGFYEPDSGVIRYNGEDLQDLMRPSRPLERGWRIGATGLVVGFFGVAAGSSLVSGTGPLAAVGIGGTIAGGVGYKLQESIRERRFGHKYSRPFRVAQRGLVRTFQITRELQGLTVLQNLMLAPQNQPGENILRVWWPFTDTSVSEQQIRAQAEEVLELLEIDHLADELSGNLSGGQQKLLELGRVLMADPDLILLDEPVAGVNPTLTQKLLGRIDGLRGEGYTFGIIEHDMDVIMELSDRIVVMDQGQTLMTGTPEEVQNDPRVIDAYLGG
jgi:branched-chain amino acid transport system ATP-binding protein